MNNSSNKKSYLFATTFIKQTVKDKNDIGKPNHKVIITLKVIIIFININMSMHKLD